MARGEAAAREDAFSPQKGAPESGGDHRLQAESAIGTGTLLGTTTFGHSCTGRPAKKWSRPHLGGLRRGNRNGRRDGAGVLISWEAQGIRCQAEWIGLAAWPMRRGGCARQASIGRS